MDNKEEYVTVMLRSHRKGRGISPSFANTKDNTKEYVEQMNHFSCVKSRQMPVSG